jgi:murein DD-endopeptidase MepM/ murein hydrolase activator NlpD
MSVNFPELGLPVRMAYESDGSAKAQFLAACDQITNAAKSRFREAGNEIGQMLEKSTAGFRGATFGVKFDSSGLRQAASEANLAAQRLRVVRDAAVELARSTGDTSGETKSYIQSLRAQVIEAEAAKRVADAQVTTYARLQTEIDRVTASETRLADASRATFVEGARAANLRTNSQKFYEQATAPGLDPFNAASRNGATTSALAAAGRHAEEADALRRAIDPAIVVQERFDAELTRATRLLDAGAISAREYGQAVGLARSNLQDGWSAITRANAAASSGAVINKRLADSQRDVRIAGIGAGQQFQDIAISMYGGQRASLVLAQQLPQLGFALSALEGNANKSLARLGALGTVLSGHLGLAVIGATVIAGPLIDRLLGSEQAAKRATDAFATQADKLNLLKSTYEDVLQASRDFNREQENSQKSALSNAAATAAQAAANIKFAITVREKLDAMLAEELKGGRATNTYTRDDGTVVQGRDSFAVAELRKARDTNRKDLEDLRKTALNSSFNIADELSKRDSDAVYRIREEYKEKRDGLSKEIGQRKELNRLRAEEAAKIETVQKAERAAGRAAVDTYEKAAFALPVSGRITSGFGPRSRPKAGASANHPAIDIAVPVGTPVAAPQVGTVTAIGFDKGLGKYVVLDHGAGTTSRFGHLSDNSIVREGELVQKGDVIAKSGNTGNSTGPHLDYQVKLNGKPVDPRSGPFPFDPTKTAEAAERAGAKLQQFGDTAIERVARITAEFDRQPRAIDRTAQATRELDKIYADLDQRNLLDPAAAAGIQMAFAAIADFDTRPFEEMVQAGREQVEIQRLVTEGRSLDAEVLERGLALAKSQSTVTAQQLVALREMLLTQRALTEEQERQDALRRLDVGYIDGTRDNLRRGLSDVARGGGIDAVGSVFKRQFALMRENALDKLFENVFGGFFTNAKDKALGFDVVKEASRDQAKVADELTAKLQLLTSAAGDAASAMSVGPIIAGKASEPGSLEAKFDAVFGPRTGALAAATGAPPASNDNAAEAPITVRGKRPNAFMADVVTKIADIFVDPRTARKIGEGISDGIGGKGNGAAYGMLSSGLILGKGGSPFGASIGGSLGEKFGEKFLSQGLESISKGLGDFAGPLGSIAGGLLGGVIGGLLTKTPKASATIGAGASGNFEVVSLQGNSASRKRASQGSAGEAIDTLDKIAEALNASIDASKGSVSIGIRKGDYRVDPSGQGFTKLKYGALDFGEDSAAAIKAATLDLIKDGVLSGLKASTQRLLQQATDLDRALQKATDFESVFTRLKEYRDPVGASLDTLDKEFTRLKSIFEQAGATTAEFVDLEALYGIERANAVKEAKSRYAGSLQGLFDELTMGDNGLSLRSRLASAQAAYDPLKARVAAGDITAFDDFAGAAQTLLGISRELNGSQSGYFDLFNEVKSLTQTALDRTNAMADAAVSRDSPFSTSAVPAQDNASVVTAIEAQTGALVAAVNSGSIATQQNLAAIFGQLAANNNSAAPMTGQAGNF